MPKRYGLTDEEKRRKAEFDEELYKQIPSDPFMWDTFDATLNTRRTTKAAMQFLDKAEKEVKERNKDVQ